MRSVRLAVALLAVLASNAFSEVVVRADGSRIAIHEDGTWKPVTEATSGAGRVRANRFALPSAAGDSFPHPIPF